MPDPWLPGFERVYNDRWSGMTYDPGYVASVVWHSIEGFGIGGAGGHTSPPHFWIDVKQRLKVQTVMLGRGSFAMGSDTPSPNRKTNCIQIEMTGFAANMAQWLTEDDYKWLGEEVLRPIAQWLIANGTPLSPIAPDVSTEQIGGSASGDAPQRFSKSTWLDWNGVCGHRHVWDQSDRYDPGLMDLNKVIHYANAGGTVKPEIPTIDEEDMLRQVLSDKKQGGDGSLYISDGTNTWAVSDDNSRISYEAMGFLKPNMKAPDGTPLQFDGKPFLISQSTINLMRPKRDTLGNLIYWEKR